MPSSNPALRLEDIIEYAGHIAEYIEGLDEAAFRKDRKTIDAVERCIERVIEATTKLDGNTKSLLGDHHAIRAIGNKLRHEYQRISDTILWGIVTTQADELTTAIEGMLGKARVRQRRLKQRARIASNI